MKTDYSGYIYSFTCRWGRAFGLTVGDVVTLGADSPRLVQFMSQATYDPDDSNGRFIVTKQAIGDVRSEVAGEAAAKRAAELDNLVEMLRIKRQRALLTAIVRAGFYDPESDDEKSLKELRSKVQDKIEEMKNAK